MNIQNSELLLEAKSLLSQKFNQPIEVDKVVQLSEDKRRNLVLRLYIYNSTRNIPHSIILKQTNFWREDETKEQELNRFAHDWAGLELLTRLNADISPVFYAGSIKHQFILLEDLNEEHHSLVGLLTSAPTIENQKHGVHCLESYMKSLAKMHRLTAGKYNDYLAIVKSINPCFKSCQSITQEDINEFIKTIKMMFDINAEIITNGVNILLDKIAEKREDYTLLHNDPCPDNVFFIQNKMYFIDFEFADYGPALDDVSYLRLHMQTCWCAKQFPFAVSDKMEDLYRAELGSSIPHLANKKEFLKQMSLTYGINLIKTINQLISLKLLEKDWNCPSGPVSKDSLWRLDKNLFRPRILSRLKTITELHYFEVIFPALAELAKKTLIHLNQQWPETNLLEYYPVFSEVSKN